MREGGSNTSGSTRSRSRTKTRSVTPLAAASGEDFGEAETDNLSEVNHDAALQWYLAELDSHIQATAHHREGRQPTLGIREDASVPAELGWTREEYALFFSGLSRHSRLRPDLIALECGRSESDVLRYLDALDRGYTKQQYRSIESGGDGNNGEYKRLKRKSKRKRHFEEGMALGAREVSEDWIRKEEVLASMVDQLVRQKELVKEEIATAKRRRGEQRAIKREVKVIEDAVERRRVRKEKLACLDRAWAQEDFGRTMDTTKLSQLHKLIHHRELRALPVSPDEEEREEEEEAQGVTSVIEEIERPPIRYERRPTTPLPPLPAGEYRRPARAPARHSKIAMDNATMKSILDIDKHERTLDQRAELYAIKHRKRNRVKARMKSLKDQGMADEEIEAKGGVDAAYLATLGMTIQDELAVTTTDDPPTVSTGLRPSRSRSRSATRQLRETTALTSTTISAESAATVELGTLLSDDFLPADSLDVINFRRLSQIVGDVNWTMSAIKDIHAQMVHELKKLVHRSILIAEMDAMQSDDADFELDAKHVNIATGFERSPHPRPIKIHESAEISVEHSDGSSEASDDTDDHDLTDEEDAKLDDALDDFDQALDSDVSKRLKQSIARAPHFEETQRNEARLQAARSDYLHLLEDTGKARRHRHAVQMRSQLFTSYLSRYNRAPTRARNHFKSRALVEDSESGDEAHDIH